MSWNQRPRTEEPQIDPFNAPDPVMPSGDQVMDSGDVEPSEERAPRGAGRPRSFDRPHKRRQRPTSDPSSARRRSTKSDDGYRAPTELPDAYEAPSTEGTPGTVAAERARASIKLARQAAREAKRAQQGARTHCQTLFQIHFGASLPFPCHYTGFAPVFPHRSVLHKKTRQPSCRVLFWKIIRQCPHTGSTSSRTESASCR